MAGREALENPFSEDAWVVHIPDFSWWIRYFFVFVACVLVGAVAIPVLIRVLVEIRYGRGRRAL